MRVNCNLLLLIISNIRLNEVFTMSIFATKGVWHYIDYPRYEGIFGHILKAICQIIFNIWEI